MSNGGRLTSRKAKGKALSVRAEARENHDWNGGDDLNGGSLTSTESARMALT